MSRNSKLRYAAEQLPPYPKINGRKVQRDSKGDIIYVNHFRELKDIQDRMEEQGYGHKHPKTAQAWAKYAAMVIAYDKRQNKKTVQEKALIGVFILLAVIAIAKAQQYFGITLF
jgi:hypothetical protein